MPCQYPGRSLVQAWIPNALAAQLRDRATAADRSIAAEVRCAVRSYLALTSEAALAGGSAKTVGDDDRAAAA